MRHIRTLLLLTVALSAAAQTIDPGGVVNAASHTETVAPGSIAAVFGSFPWNAPAQVFSAPLPTNLSDVYLQFDGSLRGPLVYVSGGQVDIQIPWELAGRSQAELSVTAGGLASAPRTVSLAQYAPAIFHIDGRGTIQDSSFRPIDPSNPARAGSTTILIYCTGLGPVTNQPASGAAAPASPLSATTTTPAVTIGGVPAQVLSSALVPGLVGLYQVTALTPVAAPGGDAVPVVLSIGGAASNTVSMAVRAPDPDQGADALVTQMTLDEKLQMVHGALTLENGVGPRGAAGWVPGIPRLGIPDLLFSDGPVGVYRLVGPATALPSSIASAASWDLDQAYKFGRVIGTETRAYGINVHLGGNINLTGREPRNGRTFETAGEDPILAGKIKAAHIRAVQDQHVIGTLKHYAMNDQETGRTVANAIIGERAARESDLLAFEIAVKDSNAQSVMCSYNLVNSVYACENDHLLNGILKGDWGFPGFVVPDWYAMHSSVTAAMAGLDQEEPGEYLFGGIWAPSLRSALASGQMPMARLDNMVHRVLRAMLAAGLFDHPSVPGEVDAAAGAAAAQEALEQGAVLLKNAAGQLPLAASQLNSIAVIGSHADVGVLSGGGSAQVMPIGGAALTLLPVCPPSAVGLSGMGCLNASQIYDPSSPLTAIQAKAPAASVRFNDGTDRVDAATLAHASSVAVVFVSRWESEGMDLPDLNFPDNQDGLVSAVAAANPHTIVVMENGGPVLTPWLDQVGAVLEAWYPGQRGGEAIANILFGSVNPSGKLPLTFPARVADLPRPVIPAPADPNATAPFPINYNEGFNVGYKWYDANGVTPLFPFGFGLSYTTFSFSNVSLSAESRRFRVTFDLANTGSMAGAEVGQVYLGLPATTGEPPRRLVAWKKVFLEPGEQRSVTIEVDERDSAHPLSYWDAGTQRWQMAPGEYTVYVGNSSSRANLTAAGTFRAEQ